MVGRIIIFVQKLNYSWVAVQLDSPRYNPYSDPFWDFVDTFCSELLQEVPGDVAHLS